MTNEIFRASKAVVCKHSLIGISATIFPAYALEKLFCEYCHNVFFGVIGLPLPSTLNFEVDMSTINVGEVLPWQEWLVRKEAIGKIWLNERII